MATSTLTVIRQRVGIELDLCRVIANGFITAFAATSFTAPNFLLNSNWASGHLAGNGIGAWRGGSATAADNYRPVAYLTPSTGAATITGPNYSDTTVGTEEVELWAYGVRPDTDFLNALNRAMEFVLFDTLEPLSKVADAGMSTSGTSNWTAISSSTLSKVTTAANVWLRGAQSLRTLNSNANGGVQSSTMTVTSGRPIQASIIVQNVVGTTTMQPYDVTNSVAFGTSVSTSERDFQYLWTQADQAPSTCRQWAIRITNSSASGDFYTNCVWGLNQDDSEILLPSWETERFKLTDVARARFQQQTGSGSAPAFSLKLDSLEEGEDYQLYHGQPDANPYSIWFDKWPSWPGAPLFLQGRRPYGDLVTFSAESDTTSAPLHVLVPAVKLQLLDSVLIPRFPNDQKWQFLRAKAESELKIANGARPIKTVAKARPFFAGVQRV